MCHKFSPRFLNRIPVYCYCQQTRLQNQNHLIKLNGEAVKREIIALITLLSKYKIMIKRYSNRILTN